MNGFAAGWRDLTGARRAQYIIGAIIVVYVVLAISTGKHGWLHHHAPIGIVLVGVVYGSVTALGAFGLVLVYRANKLINFAHGALGSMVGVLTLGLVLRHGLNYWLGLVLAVVVGAIVGGFIDMVTMRPFRNQSRLIATVATIGLAQALGGLEFIGSKHEGFTSFSGAFSPPFNVSLTIDVYTFHSAELLVVAIVPVVIAFLAWFLLRTNAGIAVRAAAENSDRALLLGIPVRRLSTIVWMIAGALAVLTYMLQAPFEGVKPGVASNGPTVLLPLLTAAVVAEMESLPVAFIASIGLGVMYQVVYWNATPSGWRSNTLIWPLYLAVIVISLLAQASKKSRAKVDDASSWSAVGALKPIPEEMRRLPEVVWTRRIVIGLVVVASIWIPHQWGASNQLLAAFAMVWALVGISLVVLTGWGGDISLGQFGIAGVAGLVAGNLVSHLNADFFLVLLAAGAAGAGIALIVGIPALRIRGLFLGVTTLALAVALDEYFLNTSNFPSWIPQSGVARPLLLQRFNLDSDYQIYIVCLVCVGLAVLATSGLRKARAGRVLIATKDNQRAAESAAIGTTGVKLAGFVVAGVIAGVAGALDVLILNAVSPGSFPSIDSITVFAYSVIGGLGSVTGVLTGVLTFKFLESITALGQVHELISGAGLLWVLSFLPGGLGQVLYSIRDRGLRWVATRRQMIVPSLVADKRDPAATTAEEVSMLTSALTDDAEREPVEVGR